MIKPCCNIYVIFNKSFPPFRDMRKHSFNHLLIVLACYDLLFIICSIPVHTSRIFEFGASYIFANLYSFFYPMTSVSFSGSIYMTVAITVERYLAVCYPHRYRELNSTMKSITRSGFCASYTV